MSFIIFDMDVGTVATYIVPIGGGPVRRTLTTVVRSGTEVAKRGTVEVAARTGVETVAREMMEAAVRIGAEDVRVIEEESVAIRTMKQFDGKSNLLARIAPLLDGARYVVRPL